MFYTRKKHASKLKELIISQQNVSLVCENVLRNPLPRSETKAWWHIDYGKVCCASKDSSITSKYKPQPLSVVKKESTQRSLPDLPDFFQGQYIYIYKYI